MKVFKFSVFVTCDNFFFTDHLESATTEHVLSLPNRLIVFTNEHICDTVINLNRVLLAR